MSKQARKYEFFYCDIETYSPSSDPQFYYGGILKEDGSYKVYTDGKDYFQNVFENDRKKDVTRVVVFFNKRYDISILQWIAHKELGYVVDPKQRGTERAIYLSGIQDEVYPYNKGRRQRPVFVIDCRKLTNGSIRSWGDELGFPKGETPIKDFYEDPNQEELDYLRRDIDIMERVFTMFNGQENVKHGLLTQSSVTQSELKQGMADIDGRKTRNQGLTQRFGKKSPEPVKSPENLPNDIKRVLNIVMGEAVKLAEKPKYRVSEKVIEDYRIHTLKRLFKQKENGNPLGAEPFEKWISDDNKRHLEEGSNQAILSAMRGGMSYVNPVFQGKRVGTGTTIDANSQYPSVLDAVEIPYEFAGFTTEGTVDVNLSKYFVAEIGHLKAKVKEGKFPFLKRSTRFTKDQTYAREIDWNGKRVVDRRTGQMTWDTCLTSVDINWLFEVYEVEEITYERVFYFKPSETFTRAVRNHIQKWYKEKEKATISKDKARRAYAKLMLNSLWGRWGMYAKNVENGGRTEDVGDKTTNYVSACFTTAYARVRLNQMMNKFPNNFIYTDTDSVHVVFSKEIPNEKALEAMLKGLLHQSAIGKWKVEHAFAEAVYLKPKTYAHRESNGSIDATTAGANVSGKVKSLDDFKTGAQFRTTKSFYDDYGRTVIQDTVFTL